MRSATICAMALGLSCLLPLAPAHAADAPRGARLLETLRERFTQADADRDGMLTEAEAKAGMPFVHRNFAAIDSAGSGRVTLDQIEDFAARRAAERRR